MNKAKGKESLTKDERKIIEEKIRDIYSSMGLRPSVNAALAIGHLNSKTILGDTGVVGFNTETIKKSLSDQNEDLIAGDMSRVECMLLDQAHTLQALMTNYISQSANAEYMSQVETFSRIALKAQNQCRQTIATLGELKNPKRVNFIRQQNNAVNQQINQGGLKQAQNSKKPDNSANKLLDEVEHERMDIGSSQEAVRGYQKVEALGAVNRAENKDRKGQG